MSATIEKRLPKITAAELLAKVREIAAANPEGTNGGACNYFVQGECKCIIGHALAALGVTASMMDVPGPHGFDENVNGGSIMALFRPSDVYPEGGVARRAQIFTVLQRPEGFDPEFHRNVAVLNHIQARADTPGMKWVEAVAITN